MKTLITILTLLISSSTFSEVRYKCHAEAKSTSAPEVEGIYFNFSSNSPGKTLSDGKLEIVWKDGRSEKFGKDGEEPVTYFFIENFLSVNYDYEHYGRLETTDNGMWYSGTFRLNSDQFYKLECKNDSDYSRQTTN